MAIVNFKASNFRGDCFVDEDFVPYLKKMNEVLKRFNFTWIVTSSFRKTSKVKGAIVPPAKKSNHMVGHAIDGNLLDNETGVYYNSRKMGDGVGEDDIVCAAIDVETGLRWGNAFKVKDSIHMDSGLNVTNMKLWEQKFKELNK